MASDSKYGLFEKEKEFLKQARRNLSDPKSEGAPLAGEYSQLVDEYERMFKQLRILVRLSDKQQAKLNKLNEQLDMRNRFIRKTFGRYLSDDIVDAILETPDGTSVGGEKKVVTILMSDLRGFTGMTEPMAAEDVVRILNIYLERMTEIVLKYRGTIDEFIGDSILAIFGAPVTMWDHAHKAVACALEMQLAMQEVNQRNHLEGFPELQMGIGINTGELVVGNIGSIKRTKYGVVGSNVNLTSRIESYTVGGQIFVSQSTRDACGSLLEVVECMEVMPKGVEAPINIYNITGLGGQYDLSLPERKAATPHELAEPRLVRFSFVTEKHTDNKSYEGKLVRVVDCGADIISPRGLRRLSEIKLTIYESGEEQSGVVVYAKVIDTCWKPRKGFRVVFTSVNKEISEYVDRLRAS